MVVMDVTIGCPASGQVTAKAGVVNDEPKQKQDVSQNSPLPGRINDWTRFLNCSIYNKIPRGKPSRFGSTFASRKRGIFP